MLECVDNFRRQYIYVYPDRKPLMLAPFNECDIQVQSTSLHYTNTMLFFASAKRLCFHLLSLFVCLLAGLSRYAKTILDQFSQNMVEWGTHGTREN